jgi:hypothetical protein
MTKILLLYNLKLFNIFEWNLDTWRKINELIYFKLLVAHTLHYHQKIGVSFESHSWEPLHYYLQNFKKIFALQFRIYLDFSVIWIKFNDQIWDLTTIFNKWSCGISKALSFFVTELNICYAFIAHIFDSD